MKAIIVLLVAIIVFGAAAYFSWILYLKPQKELQAEQAQPPPPPPPDPTIPEFNRCVDLQQSAKLIEARSAFTDFVEHYSDSTKVQDAKSRLGVINSYIYLSNYPAPETQTYLVQKGDVIQRVAIKMKSTPELVLKGNNIQGFMLRIGQRLLVPPADFSVTIRRKTRKVVLENNGHFFKEYAMEEESAPAHASGSSSKKATPAKLPKITGKVTEKVAWNKGQHVTPFDKDKGDAYNNADFWVVISPGGHSLYTEPAAGSKDPPNKPPGGGYALRREDMQELATLLQKNSPVTIE